MRAAFLALATLMSASAMADDGFPRTRRLPEPRKALPPYALDVACPRCKAEPGEPCSRRTLGRHRFHLARVEAHGVLTDGAP